MTTTRRIAPREQGYPPDRDAAPFPSLAERMRAELRALRVPAVEADAEPPVDRHRPWMRDARRSVAR